jgi:crossover junction endodeoxyribonuclease RusA
MISLTLPLPPSTNSLYRNVRGKGRVKTQRYQTWLNAAGWHVKEQRPKPIKGPVIIHIKLDLRNKGRKDCSNYIKALEDLLVSHKLIADDSWETVRSVLVDWGTPGRDCVVKAYPVRAGTFFFVPAFLSDSEVA